MKKFRLYFALLALVAMLVFLSSCSGDNGFNEPIIGVGPEDSSSSFDDSSSSSDGGGGDGDSSSSGGGGSSSSLGGSSSSEEGLPGIPEPEFTGSIAFSNPNYGNDIYFIGSTPEWNENIAITNGEAAACGEAEVSYSLDGSTDAPGTIRVCASITCNEELYPTLACEEATVVADPHITACAFEHGENVVKVGDADLPVPGVVLGSNYERCQSTDVEITPYSSAEKGHFPITATLDCGDYAPGTPVSCGDFSVILTDPPEYSQELEFTGYDHKGNNINYSVGTIVDYNEIAISNGGAGEADCGTVSYQATGFVKGQAAANSGSSSVPIKVVATYTCGGEEYKDSVEARIVPDPVLSCSWQSSPITAGTAATPVVGVANSYGRCDVAEVVFSDANTYPRTIPAPGSVNITASLDCKTRDPAPAACPALTVNPAEKVVTGIDSFEFTNGYTGTSGTHRYYIGSTPTHSASIAISNATAAGCGAVSYDITGNTAAPGTYKVTAKATCNGSSVNLAAIEATVVPNPTATCVWIDGGDTLTAPETLSSNYNGSTLTAKVIYANSWGRCSDVSAPVQLATGANNKQLAPNCGSYNLNAVNCPALTVEPEVECEWGAPKLGAYGYVKGETVTASGDGCTPANFVLDADGFTAGEKKITCGAKQVSCPAITTPRCSSCEYYFDGLVSQASGGNVTLNGATACAELATSATNASITTGTAIRYYHFTTLGNHNFSSTGNRHFINRTAVTGSAVNLNNIAQAPEGGYYMYVGASSVAITFTVSGGADYCVADPIATGSISLSYDYSGLDGDSIFFKGFSPASAANGSNVAVSNAVASKCSGVEYKVGSGAANAAGPVEVCAYCSGTNRQLDVPCAPGTVVEDPSLSGACSWNANDDTFDIDTDPLPTPSGLSVANSYGRCGSVGYYYQSDLWSNANITTAGEITGVTGKATCGGSTPSANCPTLTATGGEPASACDAPLDEFCPGVGWDEIQWNVRPQAGSRGCFYVLDITGDWGPGAPHIVNGTSFTAGNGPNRSTAANPKVDGGVYIHIGAYSNNYMHNPNMVVPGISPPFCVDGIHALYCTGMPAQGSEGTAVSQPSVTCRDGSTPGSVSWTDAPNWANPLEGTYNVSVSATCDGTPVAVGCGQLDVGASGSIIPINMGRTKVRLDANTLYEVTFTESGSVVQCNENLANDAVIGTYDNIELRLGGYNRLWIVGGSQLNPSGTHQVLLNQTLNCGREW